MGRKAKFNFRVATHIVKRFIEIYFHFLKQFDHFIRMLRDTTPWLSPPTPKVERFFFCTGSHQPPALCDSLQIVAFIIAKFGIYYNLIITKMQGKYLRSYVLLLLNLPI